MLICQISDLHIKAERKLAYQRVDTAGALERCVEALRGLDVVKQVVGVMRVEGEAGS